jgi:hypothetical protein
LSQLADTKNFPFAELQTYSPDSAELNVIELV